MASSRTILPYKNPRYKSERQLKQSGQKHILQVVRLRSYGLRQAGSGHDESISPTADEPPSPDDGNGIRPYNCARRSLRDDQGNPYLPKRRVVCTKQDATPCCSSNKNNTPSVSPAIQLVFVARVSEQGCDNCHRVNHGHLEPHRPTLVEDVVQSATDSGGCPNNLYLRA